MWRCRRWFNGRRGSVCCGGCRKRVGALVGGVGSPSSPVCGLRVFVVVAWWSWGSPGKNSKNRLMVARGKSENRAWILGRKNRKTASGVRRPGENSKTQCVLFVVRGKSPVGLVFVVWCAGEKIIKPAYGCPGKKLNRAWLLGRKNRKTASGLIRRPG